MANISELRKCADLQWKLHRLTESAKEGEEACKAHPPPQVNPQTVEMLNKELSSTHEVCYKIHALIRMFIYLPNVDCFQN